ncbi:MAG: SH3 domain-containing protein [Clostridia bacterium]|nr:SH3 domain-containing protein [Clostridia bacterium]
MKKIAAAWILALCLALSLGTAAQAELYAQVYNTDVLNIRSGPGTEYAWLGSVPRDGQVRVTGESGNWYQVATLDGSVTGYMSKNFLTVINSASSYTGSDGYFAYSASTGSYGTVSGTESLNMRTGPGTQYTVLASLGRGELVMISGEIGSWYLVSVPGSSLVGYVSKSYISLSGNGSQGGASTGATAYVNNPAGTRFLNLREAPSYDSMVLGIYYNGDSCTVLNRQLDGWVYVSIAKEGVQRYGYFRSEYLSNTPVAPTQPPAGVTATVNTWLNGGNGRTLNLRSEPGANASILARIPNGTVLPVYQQGYIWWQVSYNGATGYVDSGFLSSGGGSYIPQPNYSVNAYVSTGNSGKLNLREQANTTARVLGQYENGTGVNVIQQGSTWCYVQADSQYGYMMTKYLRITGSGNGAAKQVVNANGGTYVNLRTSPDKNSYNVNLRVPVGATVTVISWGQEWAQVNYNGNIGYMMVWFLK